MYPHQAESAPDEEKKRNCTIRVLCEPLKRPTDLSLFPSDKIMTPNSGSLWHRPSKRRCHGPPDLLGPSGCCEHCLHALG